MGTAGAAAPKCVDAGHCLEPRAHARRVRCGGVGRDGGGGAACWASVYDRLGLRRPSAEFGKGEKRIGSWSRGLPESLLLRAHRAE